jgi:hypothetical protein
MLPRWVGTEQLLLGEVLTEGVGSAVCDTVVRGADFD